MNDHKTDIRLSLSEKQVIYGDNDGNGSTPYKVVEKLGQGGNSDVYLCQCIGGKYKGLLFAVKLMTNVGRPDRVKRFSHELNFLKTINHPGVMKVFDSGTVNFGSGNEPVKVPFYVAEYLPLTLRDAMRSGLSMVNKITIAIQLISTLSYLSSGMERPIIHRDIKPENIFFRGLSTVLGDFGLLKELQSDELARKFDIDDLSKGVRHPYFYPTPELIEYAKRGEPEPSSNSDVFQLGLVFAELFCGEHPILPRKNPLDEITLKELKKFRGSESSSVINIIQNMLKLKSDERPTAEMLYDSWDGAFQGVISDAQRLEGSAYYRQ